MPCPTARPTNAAFIDAATAEIQLGLKAIQSTDLSEINARASDIRRDTYMRMLMGAVNVLPGI